MGDQKLSLTWESYQNNICGGLSLLQQRGEFVDMTLAADGHHVKVHQMVMSLVSPYIKDLISSTECKHPVIFLNKVSYETLQSVLEYAYTGEVLVARDKLCSFLEACKELHIKGLEGDTIQTKGDDDLLHLMGARAGDDPPPHNIEQASNNPKQAKVINRLATKTNTPIQLRIQRLKSENTGVEENETMQEEYVHEDDYLGDDDFKMDEGAPENADESAEKETSSNILKKLTTTPTNAQSGALIQYSLSCQGNIQLILNRYIYCIRHTRKNNERMWRCVNYNPTGCNATCVTKDDIVIFRGRAHNHPFHDKQILKRVHNNNIYTAFKTIEQLSSLNKKLSAAKAKKIISGE